MRSNSSPNITSFLKLSFPKESSLKNTNKNPMSKEINIQNIKQIGNYQLGSELGSGAFGKVVLGKHIITNETVAIKILDKLILSETPEDYELVYQEISILKIVKHKYIAQLYEILETPQHIFIIIEYCEGKDLMDYILTKNKLSEFESLKIFQQLINTLLYLHSQNITHRDIKIDNMLLDNNKNLKLVDFGLSTYYSDNELLNQPCGTVVYAAPEVLEGKEYHGMLADVWSSGIVLYGMLSGFLPFCDNDDEINKKNVIKGKINIPNFFPPLVIDLLTHMLDENPILRFTLHDIRNHPWFNLRKYNMIPGIVIGYNQIPVDDYILNVCQSFGFDKNNVKNSVKENKFDEGSALYYLLVKKFSRQGRSSVSDFGSKEFIQFILDDKNLEGNNRSFNSNNNDNGYIEENNEKKNYWKNKVCNNYNNSNNSSRNNGKEDIMKIEIQSFEKENTIINGNKIKKNEMKKIEKNNNNLLKTTKDSSNNSIKKKKKNDKIPHKKITNKKININKSIERIKKEDLNKELLIEKKEKSKIKTIQNLSMNQTIEEQLYKQMKRNSGSKIRKTQAIIIQTKIKNLLSKKMEEIKYKTSRTKKKKNYILSKSIDIINNNNEKIFDSLNEEKEKKENSKKKNNYLNTSIDNTPNKIGIKKHSVLNSYVKNNKINHKNKNDIITRNQLKNMISKTIYTNSNNNSYFNTQKNNSNSKNNILTSYQNINNEKNIFSKLNLSVQFDKIAKSIKKKKNMFTIEKNKNPKYNKYISLSSRSSNNKNSNSKRKYYSKDKNNLTRSISEKTNLQMRKKYEEKLRKNNKILNKSVCLINKKYDILFNKSIKEEIKEKNKKKKKENIINLNYYTDRNNNKMNHKYNIESSVINYRKKSPFEIRDLSDSPKNNLLNEKTRRQKIPWKIKKEGIDKNLEYESIYNKYIQKIKKRKKNKNSKLPLNQSNIIIKPKNNINELNISLDKISSTNFEKYNSMRKKKKINIKQIRIRNKGLKGKNHISFSSNISVNSSSSIYDIGILYLPLYKGPIDISCIFSKETNLSNCIKFITDKLKKNNIYYINSKQNKFLCSKNGKNFEIEIYKLNSCQKGFNPFYFKFRSKQILSDNKLFNSLFSNN